MSERVKDFLVFDAVGPTWASWRYRPDLDDSERM